MKPLLFFDLFPCLSNQAPSRNGEYLSLMLVRGIKRGCLECCVEKDSEAESEKSRKQWKDQLVVTTSGAGGERLSHVTSWKYVTSSHFQLSNSIAPDSQQRAHAPSTSVNREMGLLLSGRGVTPLTVGRGRTSDHSLLFQDSPQRPRPRGKGRPQASRRWMGS